MAFEITKALCLSTMHIAPGTARWLDSAHELITGPVAVWESSYGYFMPVYQADNEHAVEHIPDDLLRLMHLAKAHECEFLRLDRDGPIEDGIPTFDWD